MSDIKLGELIVDDQERDAIHIAIAPVVAAEKLWPAQDIGFIGEDNRVSLRTLEFIGIVDPYLGHVVYPDNKFWIFLYPNSITSLRHDWTHPAFENNSRGNEMSDHSKSIQWLKEFAEQAGLGYQKMLSLVAVYSNTGEPWVEQGSEQASNAFDAVDRDRFWKHFENVTGVKKPTDKDYWYSPFSCSC